MPETPHPLTMLRFLEEVERNGNGLPERLWDEGFHPNVVYAKAIKAARKGYTEYGVVADRPWLTRKGQAFLSKFRRPEEPTP